MMRFLAVNKLFIYLGKILGFKLVNILLVEDNPDMQLALSRALARKGMRVSVCADGGAALGMWRQIQPDLVLLDLSLPTMDGLQVLGLARQAGLKTPVLILTARGTVGDKILGLNAGADDYLPKPFDLDELEARMRALVRAAGRRADYLYANTADEQESRERQIGKLRLDKDSGIFYLLDSPLELTSRELVMLTALSERLGKAVPKEKLFERIYPGAQDVQMEAVEVLAYRLRKKLVGAGLRLVTLRGLGYLLQTQITDVDK